MVRLPKRRVLNEMKQGWIDFYPGMKFTDERSIYAYFFANGLTTGRVGLSRISMPLITNKQHLTGYSLLITLGGINYVRDVHGIKVHQVLRASLLIACASGFGPCLEPKRAFDEMLAAFQGRPMQDLGKA